MGKRFLISAVVLLLAAGIGLASEKSKGTEGSWTGWVTDTHCGAKGAKEGHADCATKCVKEHAAKYALVTPSDGHVYVLEPQDQAAAHAGHQVKVKGTVQGDTITVASIQMAGEKKGTPKEKEEKPKKQ